MSNWLAAAAFFAVTAWPSLAFACGGGFGEELAITPTQTLIVRHDAGVETYVFNPDFCGLAVDFGLILPIPTQLTANPSLVDKQIFDAFKELSAPRVVYYDVCRADLWGTGGSAPGAAVDGGAPGVDVINTGQVGIFDWSLLRADDSAAFTDWLDANQYPYDEGAVEHFDYYVMKSWYFIAFKVTAAQERPAQGSKICGSFGPIQLAFSADTPVVPTRIASVGEGRAHNFTWRIHTLAAKPMTAASAIFSETLHYAGAITREQLETFEEVATVAVEGDQLTSLVVSFLGSEVDEDITLTESSGPAEYRQTITRARYIDCAEEPTAAGASGEQGGCDVDCDAGQPAVTQTPTAGIQSQQGGQGGCAMDCEETTAASREREDGGGCSIAHDSRTSPMPLFLVLVAGLVMCCWQRRWWFSPYRCRDRRASFDDGDRG